MPRAPGGGQQEWREPADGEHVRLDLAVLGSGARTLQLTWSEAGFGRGHNDVQQYLFPKENPAR